MTSDPLLTTKQVANIGAEIAKGEVQIISPDKQFMQISLDSETPILLSVLHLVEILTVATNHVVPMFQLPPWVMGVYNWRGRILWIADLNHLLGLSPWYQQKNYMSKHTIIVLKGESISTLSDGSEPFLGLVVNQIHDIVVCDPNDIQPITDLDVAETMRPFLDGYWTEETGQLHWILNGKAVLKTLAADNATADVA